MKKLIEGDWVWQPPASTRLHIYLSPSLSVNPGLATLVAGCRKVIDEFPDVLAPVEEPFLHVTVQMIDLPAADIDPAARAALARALTRDLAGLPVFTFQAGSPIVGSAGVLLDVDLDGAGEAFTVLHERTRAVIADVLGPGLTGPSPVPPHLGLAYATASMDSGIVSSRIRRAVRPSHATWRVTEALLLDVVQSEETSTYTWGPPLARMPFTDQ